MTNYVFTGYTNGTDLGATTGCTRQHGASGEIIVNGSSLLQYVSANESLYTWNSGSTNHKFGAVVRETNNGNYFLGVVRVIDVNNFIGWRKDAGELQVFKRIAGSFTAVAAVSITTSADDYIEGTIIGTLLTIRRNGTPITGLIDLVIADEVLQTSTLVGLHGRSQGANNVIVSVTVDTAAAQTITSVNSGNPVKLGGTVTIAVAGFTKAITKGTIDGVSLSAASATSITVPGLVDETSIPRVGAARVLIVSSADDTETATVNITVANPDDWTSVVIEADFNTGEEDSIIYDFDPELEVNDIIFNDPEKGEVFSDAGGEFTYIGTQTLWHHDVSTKIVYSFDLIIGNTDTNILIPNIVVVGIIVPEIQIPTIRGLD